MKISVITTVFNGESTLEQTIFSVASQTHPDVEHIIIDGGSTDGTLEVINRHLDKITCFISEPDAGIYDGMNKGISRATGEVIGFLNSDDFYFSNDILEQIADTLSDPKIEGCFANLLYVDSQDTSKVVRYWNSREYRPGLFERGWMPAHPTFYVKKPVYDRFGGFDIDLKFHADFEHTARLMAVHKIKTRFIPNIWVRMRAGGATNRSIGNVVKGNLESYQACKKLGLKVTPLYFMTKFLMRIPQFFARPS